MELLYDADAIYGHASTQQPQKPRELEFFEMIVVDTATAIATAIAAAGDNNLIQ